MEASGSVTWIMVKTRMIGIKTKSAEPSALYYEFGSLLRTRHADYDLIRLKKSVSVVRGAITRLPFSLLYAVDARILTAVRRGRNLA